MDVLHGPKHSQAGVHLHGIDRNGHHQHKGNGSPDDLQLGVAFNRFGITGVIFLGPVTQDHPAHHRGHSQEHKGANRCFKAEEAIHQGRRGGSLYGKPVIGLQTNPAANANQEANPKADPKNGRSVDGAWRCGHKQAATGARRSQPDGLGQGGMEVCPCGKELVRGNVNPKFGRQLGAQGAMESQ